jgi:hypothetical protein
MKVKQNEILERIAELEGELTVDGNSARDKMIEQGSLINMAVSDGLVLKEVAAKCGLTLSNARVRSSVAARMSSETGLECQALLNAHETVHVSFDALASVLSDPEPTQLLSKLLSEAYAAEKSRVTRDAVRQGRGNKPGTVGTVNATIARMKGDPVYARQMLELLAGDPDLYHEAESAYLRKHNRGNIAVPPSDWSSKSVLTRLTLAVKQLRSECNNPGDLTENARATIEWALAELTAIKEGRDFVGEIEAWLESSTP